jgi:hypothetical protein
MPYFSHFTAIPIVLWFLGYNGYKTEREACPSIGGDGRRRNAVGFGAVAPFKRKVYSSPKIQKPIGEEYI